MTRNNSLSHEKILDWVIPTFLAALLTVLGWIAININEMSKSLAIAVLKIDDHEKRIVIMEKKADHFQK